MGGIHTARDAALSREVAWKVLLPRRAEDRQYRIRFVREARLTAQLQHPNIVPVHDLGIDSEGRLFFTMKRVRGRSLYSIIRLLRAHHEQTVLEFTQPRLLTAFGQVCQAVHYAHTRGVLHRDIKPDNIMLGAYGEVLVMDWGLAKRIQPLEKGAGIPGSDIDEDTLKAFGDAESGRLASLLGDDLPSEVELADTVLPDENTPLPVEDSDGQGPVSGRLDELDSEFSGSALPGHSIPDPLGHVGKSAGEFETVHGRVMGTPTHMAPEQARGRELDIRCDVYGLGAVLYEILTHRPAFRGRTANAVMVAVAHGKFAPPREAAPGRPIDPAIESICLKAMSLQPSARFATAWELFEAVEAFLQGRTERERRRTQAELRIEEARDVQAQWWKTSLQLDRAGRDAAHQAAATPAWAGVEERRRLWTVEDQRDQLALRQIQQQTELIQLLQEALRLDPTCEESSRLLAELYWKRLREAEETSDLEGRVRWEAELRSIDDGRWAARLEMPGRLSIEAYPRARVTLYRYIEVDRRFVASDPRELGLTPCEVPELAPGRYLVELRCADRATALVPLRVRRDESVEIAAELQPSADVGEGWVHVPAGTALIGGDPQAGRSLEPVEAFVPDFAMSVMPVRMSEYLEFLDGLVDQGLADEAWARAPRREATAGQYLLRGEGGALTLPERDDDGHEWDPNLPVMSVSHADAVAYAQWRSQQDGARYRLPTDAEWEKAARGTDGRIYPWGDRFDPSFCLCRGALPSVQPRPVGWAEADCSPYGVRDLAGGSRDWCDGWKTQLRQLKVQRGGAWWDRPENSRAAARVGWAADNVFGDSGIRLVKSLPLEPPGPAEVPEGDPRRGGLEDDKLPAQ